VHRSLGEQHQDGRTHVTSTTAPSVTAAASTATTGPETGTEARAEATGTESAPETPAETRPEGTVVAGVVAPD